MSRNKAALPEHSTVLPKETLRQYKPGMLIWYKAPLGSGYYLHGPAEFVKLERGLVTLKYLPGWTPNWVDAGSMAREHPDGTIRVRFSSCYYWGCGQDDFQPCCHWFRTMDDPLE